MKRYLPDYLNWPNLRICSCFYFHLNFGRRDIMQRNRNILYDLKKTFDAHAKARASKPCTKQSKPKQESKEDSNHSNGTSPVFGRKKQSPMLEPPSSLFTCTIVFLLRTQPFGCHRMKHLGWNRSRHLDLNQKPTKAIMSVHKRLLQHQNPILSKICQQRKK